MRFWSLVAVLLIQMFVCGHARAVPQNDIGAVGGNLTRGTLGTGRGVIIGILDGGIDANHPAVRGSVVAAADFSGSGTTNDDPGEGHATGIAGLYVGHDSAYTGLVPKASIINARVITPSDYTNNRMAGNGLFYALGRGAKVVNMSFGNRPFEGPLTSKFNLMVDYAAAAYGASIVTAAGNESDTAVDQVPAGAFNAFSIGALAPTRYDHVSDFSNFAFRTDRRSKPDLVAPGEDVNLAAADWETHAAYYSGSGTSFSAPITGGVLAQMIGYGQSRGLVTDPMLMRALLMTSAKKVYDLSGSGWSPRHSVRSGTRLIYDQPLDNEQGAGRVDAPAAYTLYSKSTDSSTAYTNWFEGRMRRYKSNVVDLGHLSKGQRVDATLSWLHHIAVDDTNRNGVADYSDNFYESAALADFVLTLFRDGVPVVSSDSKYDNFEHLAININTSGNYLLEIHRYAPGVKSEAYAFAARVLNSSAGLGSFAAAMDAQATLPSTGVMRSVEYASALDPIQVPEPTALSILAPLAAGLLLRRRR